MLRPGDYGLILFVLFLLVCSALISGSETAFFSLSPKDAHHFKTHPSSGSKAVLKLLSMQESLLATILIANNLVSITIVLVSDKIIDSWLTFDSTVWEFVVKMVAVTFLLLFFGDIIPKIFASHNPVGVARMMSAPLLFLRRLFRPLEFLLVRSGSHLNEIVAKRKVNISMDQLSNAIEITANQTVEERQMLSGIVSFVDMDVAEIMKPRVDIVALDREDSFARVKDVIIASGFSRIPVYEESVDKIKGVLYVKDVLAYIGQSDQFEWPNLLRKAYFVPEYKKINELLEEFQQNQIHLAIVVDEYGSTQGLVTLEDILEEIVGEIEDESDKGQTFYTKIDDNTYVFEGKTHLSDLLKVLKIDDEYLDEVKGEAESLAGLMLEIRKDFLAPGDVVHCKELTLEVQSVMGHRIEKVHVIIGLPEKINS